jgi:transcriptional repressor NrdR
MRCPFCQQDDDRVIDSRATDDGTAIRRRRVCNACSKRFTTYERVEGEETLRVVKRDGRSQAFDRRKILHGMEVACEKRAVTAAALEGAANRIHQQLISEGDREVPVARIGELVMEELRRLDQVAYVRFASVYRQFKDLDELLREVRLAIAAPMTLSPLPAGEVTPAPGPAAP